jgi:hypothetical protein
MEFTTFDEEVVRQNFNKRGCGVRADRRHRQTAFSGTPVWTSVERFREALGQSVSRRLPIVFDETSFEPQIHHSKAKG